MPQKAWRFETATYPTQDVLSLSAVVGDYLNQDPKVNNLISTFQDLSQLGENIKLKQKSFHHRKLLHTVLLKQNDGFEMHNEQIENVKLLIQENCFCITTAHQTNLFGGPLYFVQKAVSAIKACQLAKQQYPDYEFVPIYWLGTEDHDFDELNHTTVNGKKLVWKDEQGGAFGRYKTASLKPLLNELFELLGNSKNAAYLKNLFNEAYINEKNIASATRVILNELLGQHGLLIIDGDDRDLKQAMIPIFERELKQQFSTKVAQNSIQFLENEYGYSQAHSRSINLFYLTDNSRKRIIKQPYGFSVYGTKLQFSEQLLLQELNQYPERFSPNVMLRPLMQEICLPNLLYVGGGGELSYWFQLKPIFEATDTAFPMLGLRDTAIYINQKIHKKIKELDLSILDFFDNKQNLIKEVVQRNTAHNLSLSNAKSLVQQAMKEMEENARKIDFTLSASAKAEEQRMQNALSNLEKKMMRAEKKNHQITLQRIDSVYNELRPNGSLQERVQNFSQYYLLYDKSWLDWMLKEFNLFDQKVKVMMEE